MNGRRKSPLGDSEHILSTKEDVTHLLILRFQQLLSDGVLSPGTKLPSERELAANFGVARSSLRQALKVLEIMGVITQKVRGHQPHMVVLALFQIGNGLPQQRNIVRIGALGGFGGKGWFDH